VESCAVRSYSLSRFYNPLNLGYSPRCIIEQFFHNQYSTAQRFAMLNALALGARELADLRLPPSNSKTPVSDFPSKKLAPALHRRYIAYAEESGVVVDDLMRGITRQAIEKGREEIEDKIPEVVREKQLRVKRTIAPAAIVDLSKDPTKTATPKFQATKTPYKDVAAEYFISPLINRFWLYLRDEHTRESRTAYSTQAYKGTGTGMILDSLLLSRYLSTLGLLLHAARHSMAFLTVLAPESLEVAVTMGSRPASSIASNGGKTGSEGAVLASALELALIILDACADLDGGQTLALEHTALLLGIQEWVKAVFEKLEGGERVAGGGGEFEGRMRGASAGLVIRVEDIVRRWSRAMIGGNAFTT
jgi:telomere length regulation protein